MRMGSGINQRRPTPGHSAISCLQLSPARTRHLLPRTGAREAAAVSVHLLVPGDLLSDDLSLWRNIKQKHQDWKNWDY